MAESSVRNRLANAVRTRHNLFTYLAVVLIGGLSVESIWVPIRTYIAPLTSLLAAASLPICYLWLRRTKLSPLFTAVSAFVGYAFVHSLLFLGVDLLAFDGGLPRVVSWIKELVALSVGISVFYVLRHALARVSTSAVARIGVIGAVPALTLACLTLLWQLTGVRLFAVLPLAARRFVSPTGYDGLSRTTGLSSEPAHFAFFLVTIVLPLVIIGYTRHRSSWIGTSTVVGWLTADDTHPSIDVTRTQALWIGAFLITLVAFVGTLSTFGVLVFLVFWTLLLLLSGRWKPALAAGLGIAGFFWTFITLFPGTYIATQLTLLVSGNWGYSILMRYYSTIGPLTSAVQSLHGLLGYGLGGMGIHFRDFLPPNAIDAAGRMSWVPGQDLQTLAGRIIAETGVVGVALFVLVVLSACLQLIRLHDSRFKATDTSRLNPATWPFPDRVVVAALLTTVFGHVIGMGSFSIPYLWFWLAFIDAQYIEQSVTSWVSWRTLRERICGTFDIGGHGEQ